MERAVCVHGHFYQPLREDPWLEAIEVQDSAQPFHDWNERITAECYGPNATARILDKDGFITLFLNNYAHMSFDFGPTLLAWMERHATLVYRAVLEADRESLRRCNGHGSAIAQCYSHLIMPLATAADKMTQIRWAVRDFEHRFQRSPAGMWLPETAVDLQSLELLAEAGIRFVLLAPQQAARLRRSGEPHWMDIGPGGLDTTMPYAVHLPNGRRLAAFFFHGPLSQAVAFDKSLLNSGETFARRIRESYRPDAPHAQLLSVVTDGETFGHHHPRGETALAFALHNMESDSNIRLTNFAEHLERHPPTHEVQVHENTAWSCAHGVGRWRADCGCSNHRHAHWNQRWRAPLREALDWLHVTLTPAWFKAARRLLKDPWAARNDYINVLLERSAAKAFLEQHGVGELNPTQRVTIWKLLELQRHAMLMFTSCGWFHDDVTGIETMQNLKHAARVAQLARELFGDGIEPRFLELLHNAKSNLAEYQDAAWAYEHWVRPAVLDLPRLAAHYAARRLFEDDEATERLYSYEFSEEQVYRHEKDEAVLVAGRATCRSVRTDETAVVWFAAVNHGSFELQFAGGLAGRDFSAMRRKLTAAFHRGTRQEITVVLQENFTVVCAPSGLFRDEQRRLSRELLKPVLAEAEVTHRKFYQRHAPLLEFLGGLGAPAPATLQMAANIALQGDLRQAFAAGTLTPDRLARLLMQAKNAGVRIDRTLFGETLGGFIARQLRAAGPPNGSLGVLAQLAEILRLAGAVPEADFTEAQNTYLNLRRTVWVEHQVLAGKGDADSREWLRRFEELAPLLRVGGSISGGNKVVSVAG